MSSSADSATAASDDDPLASLNAFWCRAAHVVTTGDFDAYAAMYHPEAVLVQLQEAEKAGGTTTPIATALDGWRQGFADTAAGRQHVDLQFRFGRRLHDATTAHETGVFRYTCTSTQQQQKPDAATQTVLLHFESLLVKRKPQGWLWMMEYQKHPASQEEWEALDPLPTESDDTQQGQEL